VKIHYTIIKLHYTDLDTDWMIKKSPYPVTIHSAWWVFPYHVHAAHFLFNASEVIRRFWNWEKYIFLKASESLQLCFQTLVSCLPTVDGINDFTGA